MGGETDESEEDGVSKCGWCEKEIYYGLKLCTLHGDFELSKYFIQNEPYSTYLTIQSLSGKEEEDAKEKEFRAKRVK